MTRRCSGGDSDAPLRPTHDDRIHNSGWGRPAEQYRTPALGAGFVIDLHRTLLSWRGMPPDVREMLAGLAPRRRRFPTDVMQACARALLHAVTGDWPPAETDRRTILAQLCDAMINAGHTDGVVLICALVPRDALATPLDHLVSAHTAALALATAICTRPPTVMWGIEPSVTSVTVDDVLRVRWLQRARAGAVARDVWESMTHLTSPGATHA